MTNDDRATPTPADADPHLVNSREAARMLCVSERTLFSLAASGELPRVRVRGSVRYDRRDLFTFIDRLKAPHANQ